MDGAALRPLRGDAAANRDKVLSAAVRVVLRDGPNAPMARIAAEAGVGVATLYRRFPDRSALNDALQSRSYALVADLLDEILAQGGAGIEGVQAFLLGAFQLRGDLVLPYHGASPSSDPGVRAAARTVGTRIATLVERGHADETVRAAVTGRTVVEFSALLIEGLPHATRWDRSAAALRDVFVRGIAGSAAPPPGRSTGRASARV